MNRPSAFYAPLIGRILVGGYFLWTGIQEILNLPFAVSMLALAGLPQPTLLAVFAGTVMTVGGIALVADYRTQPFAWALVAYLLVSSLTLFTNATPSHVQLFLQSMAIVGGLLFIASCNPTKQRAVK
ncbi:MAG: DoxX family protein [bacterium]